MKTQERIELKHLAPYLPYGLKFLVPNDEHSQVQTMTGLSKHDGIQTDYEKEDEIGCIGNLWLFEGDRNYEYYGIKPLLHPLSRLTDEHIAELEGCHNFSSMSYSDIRTDPTRYPFTIVQKLLEWHFDVFGLIDKGLAEPIELTDKD